MPVRSVCPTIHVIVLINCSIIVLINCYLNFLYNLLLAEVIIGMGELLIGMGVPSYNVSHLLAVEECLLRIVSVGIQSGLGHLESHHAGVVLAPLLVS